MESGGKLTEKKAVNCIWGKMGQNYDFNEKCTDEWAIRGMYFASMYFAASGKFEIRRISHLTFIFKNVKSS